MLSPADRVSREVQLVCALLEQRVAKHRASLEGDQDEKTTTLLRGRIRECKELLAALTLPAQEPAPLGAVGMVGVMPDFLRPQTHE